MSNSCTNSINKDFNTSVNTNVILSVNTGVNKDLNTSVNMSVIASVDTGVTKATKRLSTRRQHAAYIDTNTSCKMASAQGQPRLPHAVNRDDNTALFNVNRH